MRVADQLEYVTWQGMPESVQFTLAIPESLSPQNVIGTVRISSEGVPLGHFKFKLKVTAQAQDVFNEPTDVVSGSPLKYEKAFISYASEDRNEVLKRVQMLSKFRISFFQDVLDLEPGVRWEKDLYRHIDESDLFLLFWSSAAKRSEWVMKEVQYALSRKTADSDPPEILPVILEGPPPVAPPRELAHLHFDDHLIYFMRE